jgi:hypothetical protein
MFCIDEGFDASMALLEPKGGYRGPFFWGAAAQLMVAISVVVTSRRRAFELAALGTQK